MQRLKDDTKLVLRVTATTHVGVKGRRRVRNWAQTVDRGEAPRDMSWDCELWPCFNQGLPRASSVNLKLATSNEREEKKWRRAVYCPSCASIILLGFPWWDSRRDLPNIPHRSLLPSTETLAAMWASGSLGSDITPEHPRTHHCRIRTNIIQSTNAVDDRWLTSFIGCSLSLHGKRRWCCYVGIPPVIMHELTDDSMSKGSSRNGRRLQILHLLGHSTAQPPR